MTVAQLSATMSSSELTEWAIYFKLKADEQEKATQSQPKPPTIHRRR